MADTFNWCFIGTGNMAKTAARQMAFTRSKSHRIVSSYSRTYESANKFALWFGGKAYKTLEEAVMAPNVDAVYIATPHSCHFELAMQCIKLAKPVLIEKPFTLNSKECEELFNFANENGVYIAEAMWTWFSPIAQNVKEWVNSGDIGKVKNVDIKYAMATSKFYHAPRLFDKNQGGGSLLDIGVYPLAYCYNVFGYPSKILCEGDINADGVDEGEKIILEYPNDLVCNISVSLTRFEGPEYAVITGTKGVITIPLFHQAVRATLMSDEKKEVTRSFTTYMTEFDMVAEEIRNGELHSKIVLPETTKGIMKLMDECRRQMGIVYPSEEADVITD
ncbi:MAG: Gfo/Idh/MocA family oxidoreductase [Oscillospiraceae bacterium]